MRKSGIAFHCHHNFLCEPVFDYDERVASIKETKPKEEQELRLRLLQLFPNDRLPQTLVKAGEDYSKAGEAYRKAREARIKAREAYRKAREAYSKAGEARIKAREAYSKAGEARIKAREAHRKAEEACSKAREAYVKAREDYSKAEEDYRKDIVKLHAELCPNCPWDGHTIFTREDKDGNWY